ncbi:MAG: DUF86 domain-containing protein [Phormidesmis sp.]
MLQSAERVVDYIDGASENDFEKDMQLQDAVIRRLLVIGEAAGRVSEKGRNALPEIEWTSIRGLRNRLVHEYDNIKLEVVWEIAQTEMTGLISKIKPIIPPEDQLSVFGK